MKVTGLRFHGLQGKPKRWSVRATGIITFGWLGEDALEIDFEDYH
jgi:proteic killer suppression protein